MSDVNINKPEQDEDAYNPHLAEAHKPDVSWQRFQPIQLTLPKGRLNAPSSTVSIKNTSDVTLNIRGKAEPQKHVVLDRGMVGHEIEAGETLHNIQMLNSEIEYFRQQRRPGRRDRLGRLLPQHPIEILDVKSLPPNRPEDEPTKAAEATAAAADSARPPRSTRAAG